MLRQSLTSLMEWPGHLYKKLELLDKAIVKCQQCPRLVEWREEVAITKRKAYENEKYWGKPVPGFGPANAKLVILVETQIWTSHHTRNFSAHLVGQCSVMSKLEKFCEIMS